VVKNIILNSFELINAQTDIIYTDFSKAFDHVSHEIIFRKLQIFDFSASLLNWFQSFLSGRHQSVKYLNFTSKQFIIPSGVPQGDHLSTLLFNIFINDLPNVITNSNILLFADDAKLVKIIKSEQDAFNLQLDINILWCNKNNLFLNIQKCKFMKFYLIKNPVNSQYSISGTNVELVNRFKDLGTIFDRKLNFSLHTEMIKNKAFRNLVPLLNVLVLHFQILYTFTLLLSKCLQKLILGSIDCPEILSLIRFKINYLNTRDPKPFYPLFSTKNYISNSLANLLMTAGNTFVFDYI